MDNLRVRDFRLSLIWTETQLRLLDDGREHAVPLSFLGDRDSYEARFDSMLAGAPDPMGLRPPWHQIDGGFFWFYYLGETQGKGAKAGEIKGRQAWRSLVPFRSRIWVDVEEAWRPDRVFAEAFLYPHGMAVAFSAELRGDLPIFDAVKKAYGLRREAKVEFQWGEAKSGEPMKLDAFGREALSALRQAILGPGGIAGAQASPFSVATIVNATGLDPAALATPIEEEGEVHRALQALSTWSPSWEKDTLTPLAEAGLPLRSTAPRGHFLFGSRRGRAVWFPGLYAAPETSPRSLGCYHRNLLLASAQVESLAGLALEIDRARQSGTILVGGPRECAKRAVGHLGRLYGRESYGSWSPRFQIDQNGYREPINRLRDYFQQPELH